MSTIVATARARAPGRCDHCGRTIRRGEQVHKVDTGQRGPQTRYGNGRGTWVCDRCAGAVEPEPI